MNFDFVFPRKDVKKVHYNGFDTIG